MQQRTRPKCITTSGQLRMAVRILTRMTTPIPTRFSDEELAIIDRLVRQGVGENRSEVIRSGVRHLEDHTRRVRAGEAIAESYRSRPQSREDDDFAMANALAMTDAEPW